MSFNFILTVSTFDRAVSHLSLTRAEKEEGIATMGESEATRGTGRSEVARIGGEGGTAGPKLKGLTG